MTEDEKDDAAVRVDAVVFYSIAAVGAFVVALMVAGALQ
jgi:hypothetical protein